jgi:hypothetical protein
MKSEWIAIPCRSLVAILSTIVLAPGDTLLYAQLRNELSAPRASGTAWRGTTRMAPGAAPSALILREPSSRATPVLPTPIMATSYGYFIKTLKGQGPAAPLGEMDFMIQGPHDRRLRPGGGAGRV